MRDRKELDRVCAASVSVQFVAWVVLFWSSSLYLWAIFSIVIVTCSTSVLFSHMYLNETPLLTGVSAGVVLTIVLVAMVAIEYVTNQQLSFGDPLVIAGQILGLIVYFLLAVVLGGLFGALHIVIDNFLCQICNKHTT